MIALPQQIWPTPRPLRRLLLCQLRGRSGHEKQPAVLEWRRGEYVGAECLRGLVNVVCRPRPLLRGRIDFHHCSAQPASHMPKPSSSKRFFPPRSNPADSAGVGLSRPERFIALVRHQLIKKVLAMQSPRNRCQGAQKRGPREQTWPPNQWPGALQEHAGGVAGTGSPVHHVQGQIHGPIGVRQVRLGPDARHERVTSLRRAHTGTQGNARRSPRRSPTRNGSGPSAVDSHRGRMTHLLRTVRKIAARSRGGPRAQGLQPPRRAARFLARESG